MGGKDAATSDAATGAASTVSLTYNRPNGADATLSVPARVSGAQLRALVAARDPTAVVDALQLQLNTPVVVGAAAKVTFTIPSGDDAAADAAAPPGGALVPVVHVDADSGSAQTYTLHDGARLNVTYGAAVGGAAKAAGLKSPSLALAEAADMKAPAPALQFRIRHVSSGKYVHVQGGVAGAASGTRLVLHSGGDTSRDTLFEWTTLSIPAPQPQPQSQPQAAQSASAADTKVDTKSGAEAVAGAGKGAGKSAPLPSDAAAAASGAGGGAGVTVRTLRHVVTGMYVHPRNGVARCDTELVLWPSFNAGHQTFSVAMRAARLDLEAGSTGNCDADAADADSAEGRDGGPVQLATHTRDLCVHPAGGLSGAAVRDNTPLLWHKPGASPVTTFVFEHARA